MGADYGDCVDLFGLRQRLQAARKRKGGTICPVCDQFCFEYRRKLNTAMAYWLCLLVRRYLAERRFYSIHELPHVQGRRGGGDGAKLIYWGLVYSETKGPEERGRTSGRWAPTQLGIDFALGRVMVSSHVVVFNKQCLGQTGEPTDIIAALGKRFDYRELMGHPPPNTPPKGPPPTLFDF